MKIFEREITKDIDKWSGQGFIVAILGARQVGKTTLLKEIQKKEKNPCFYYSLDDEILRAKIKENFYLIREEIEASLGIPLAKHKGKITLLIDEAQKAPEVFNLVKIFYDEYKEKFKIFLSGSSSLELQKKGAESLAGRVQYAYLFPLSIKEILKAKGYSFPASLFSLIAEDKLSFAALQKIQAPLFAKRQELKVVFEKLLVEGALPFIWQRQEKERNFAHLRSVVNTYLEKDIRVLGKVGELESYQALLETLSFQLGAPLNLSKISHQTQISLPTLRSYRSILTNTFVVNLLSPFLKNPKKRLVKAQKIYFFDVEVANFLAGRENIKNIFDSRVGAGIFENIIIKSFEAFAKNYLYPIRSYFWQDYQGREIDLVMSYKEKIIPVEITFSSELRKEKLRNFSLFFSSYKRAQYGIVIYTGVLKEVKQEGKKIFCLPWWMWG